MEQTYPIKAVALKTGLSIHVIRAWEKRYQALNPERTDTNRRVYYYSDIEKLSLLKQAVDEGHNIGSVAHHSIDELKEIISEIKPVSTENPVVRYDTSDDYLTAMISAIRVFDSSTFERILFNAALQLSLKDFLETVLLPLITRIGILWHGGDIRIRHEHMATEIIKSFVTTMRNSYRIEEDATRVIIATPVGQRHELGALIIALIAASEGFRVIYLGADLPADEIVSSVEEKQAKAVMLSIVFPANDPNLKEDLKKLSQNLPEEIKLIVGGSSADAYFDELKEMNSQIIHSVTDFKQAFQLIA